MKVVRITRSSSFLRKLTQIGASVICLLTLLMLPGRAWAKQTPLSPDLLGSIAGVVTDSQGTPLPNIEVSALVGNNNGVDTSYTVVCVVMTDATGAYQFPVLATGVYRLQFRDPRKQYILEFYNHAATPQTATELAVTGNNLSGINTALSMGGRITGTVTLQNATGILSGNADIYGQGNTGWQILASVPITQASSYDFGALLPGVYRICFTGNSQNGILSNCYGNSQTVQNAADIKINAGEIKANQNIDAGAGQFDGVISGVVTADGAPKAGIKVGLYHPFLAPFPTSPDPFAYSLTDQTGSYRIGGLTVGDYVVGFSDPAGRYATTFFPDQRALSTAPAFSLQNSQVISNVNVTLVHGGQISGHVQRAHGEPLANVLVQLFWNSPPAPSAPSEWQPMMSYYTKTNTTGNYTLQGLWPGAYRLSFQLCPVPYDAGPPCELEYYSAESDVLRAVDVKVEAGKTTPEIDVTLGMGYVSYLPLAAR